MSTGTVPNADQARAEFPELTLEEMGEGFLEFQTMMARYEKGA